MIFGYDSSKQALVYPGPKGEACYITVAELQKNGWIATEAGLRACLPRVDKSNIAIAPAAALPRGGRR
jgi:hypothetical protein